jgi:uncharacterized membrane-anchored protein YjiN (DUF445 family)
LSPTQDQVRTRRLRRMRLLATGLLLAMAALYVATGPWLASSLTTRAPWLGPALGYVNAFAEAATIGACADWFAVTALFRRPFGLPIPHTGIIPRNKDRIGAALGGFIADNFLTAEILEARLRQLEVGRWGAAWLRKPANAALVAERLVGLIPELLALSTPQARRRFVGAIATDVIAAIPAAPLAAGVLRSLSSGPRRDALLDAGLDLIGRALASNQDLVRAEVASRTYRWLPRWLDEQIAGRLLVALTRTIEEMRGPEHPWRDRVGAYLDDFIDRLETDPELAARAEAIKRQITTHPLLLDRLGQLSDALEARLRPGDEGAARELTDRLAGWFASLGAWLCDEAEAVEIFNDWARQAVQQLIAPRRRVIGRSIASVVAGWDVQSVVEKLELQVGADLQYIRINGTIVGGLVGLLIYALSTRLGPHR